MNWSRIAVGAAFQMADEIERGRFSGTRVLKAVGLWAVLFLVLIGSNVAPGWAWSVVGLGLGAYLWHRISRWRFRRSLRGG